jgi:hypothetical protein
MNVQEQHIEINISSQKIRSNYYRKFLDSEIDWIMNKQVDRFIKDRIKADQDSLGFDATEIDMEALRTLVVLDRQLRTFKIEDDAVRSELPGNFSYRVDIFCNTTDQCDSHYTTDNKVTTTNLYLYSFPVTETVKADAPYYQALRFVLGNVDILNVTGLTGLAQKSELFTVRDYTLGKLWQYTNDSLQSNPEASIDFYWEEFGNIRKPGNIIVVCKTQQTVSNKIYIDGTSTDAVETIITKDLYTPSNNGKLYPARVVKGFLRSSIRSSTFAGTRSNSPIAALSGNQIKVYHDKKLIVSKLSLSYIRKPAKINLLLSQNCDLAPEFHQEICDRTVLYIKELTLSPDWEIKLKDMMMNKD